ncbi:MAG: glycine cleavage T C-terminal barrel domain-containing protein, partial [Candidatus Binatia bacterium]
HAGGAEVVDRSDELGLLALQGPAAAAILAPFVDADLATLKSFAVTESQLFGVPVMLSRTGYTGEDGFEIYLDANAADGVWENLLEAGRAKGLVPAGLGARDTLRLEAGLALYGNDIDAGTTPLEAGLAWVVKFDKGDFVGKDALLRQRTTGLPRRLVGLEMLDGSIPRHGYAIRRDGRAIGVVTSGTKSPTLGRGIALGYVENLPGASEAGGDEGLAVEIRGVEHPARFVRPPFVRRGSSGGEKR